MPAKKTPAPFDPAKCTQLALTNHGGGCCGISHIHGFPATFPDASTYAKLGYICSPEDGEMRIRYLIGKYWADTRRTLDGEKNRLYEIVLQSSQRATWEEIILRIGFVLTTDFKNTNSGNRVFVYHYAMGPANAGGAYVSPYKAAAKSLIPNPFAKPAGSREVAF